MSCDRYILWTVKKGFIVLILIGLCLRIFIVWYAFGYRENTDILRWKDWAQIAYLHSFVDTYKPDFLTFGTYPNNMPPGTLYIVYAIYQVWLLCGKIFIRFGIYPGSNNWINGPFLTLLLRIPSLVADIGVGILVYILSKGITKRQIIASMLYYFNPVVLYNSAFMGQMDSINNFLWLVGFYLFLKKKYVFVGVFVALSLLVKFSLLYTLPFLAYIMWVYTKKISLIIMSISGGIITTLAAVLPLSDRPFQWYVMYFIHNFSGEMQHMTNFAFNVWWVIFGPYIAVGKPESIFSMSDIRLINAPYVDSIFWGVPLGLWAICIYILILFPLVITFYKSCKSTIGIVLFYAALCLVSFLFLPKMHDRYLYPAVPFLAIAASLRKSFLIPFTALSVLNFINLYFVWHPQGPLSMYLIVQTGWLQWIFAVLTVAVGMFLYRTILRNIQNQTI